MIKLSSIFSLLSLTILLASTAATAQTEKEDVYVDDSGIMRWGHNDDEVHGFGVNYSAPFAHAYRSAEKKGLNIKAEMDQDIYHFTRLNFDLYRLHVWDTEISDEKGNLLDNEHLDAFDYLLNELKKRDINFVITPIAYWGNGWPEPDEDTPGFSNTYGKDKSLTDPEAIKAQENYLAQFLDHINPYTGIAYKDEPNLIAFEVSNEPHHRGSPEQVKTFINKMVAAMKSTGVKKPIFYNVSHSVHLADTYFTSEIDGGTFQWYPTGLGFQQELEGNLLPNVNDYNIPFNDIIKENNKAKLVYEFDAADVNKSFMYPAMARSFREAGIQIATHFAYDPTFLADVNTEYNTHYMNLNYTPHKALALMIASEIFHKIPMNKDLGTYPDNLEFGDFKISYEGDVAIYNAAEKFIYTNSTEERPKSVQELKQIAGHGNSAIITYEGKGAYFLDKLEDGAWRLEVMPDPILIENPFGGNSLDKTVSVISWKENSMSLNLDELGENFTISGLNEGNEVAINSEVRQFDITPGTYLVKAAGKDFNIAEYENNRNFELEAFEAKEASVDKTYLVHEPVANSTEGTSIEINATIVSDKPIKKVEAWFANGNTYESAELKAKNNYDYTAEVPEKLLENGFLKYRIIVSTSDRKITFPGGVEGSPSDWDFHSEEQFETTILGKDAPVYIFNAATDSEKVVRKWNRGNKVIPVGKYQAEFQVRLDKLFQKDVENLEADPIYDYSFRYNFSEKLGTRSIANKQKMIIEARSLAAAADKIQVALILNNGAAFGKTIELSNKIQEIEIDLKQLVPVKTVTLPRPYPGFLPYYFDHSYKGGLKMEDVEAIQFSIGPGLEKEKLQQVQGVGVRSVKIQ